MKRAWCVQENLKLLHGSRASNKLNSRKELGVSSSMLHRWRQRFEPELKGSTQPSKGEREEIERLRGELRDAKAEKALLKKAAALFAKEVK